MYIKSSSSGMEGWPTGEGEYLKMSHQLLFSPFCFMKSLILSFNETLLTVPLKHGAAEGTTFPPEAGHCILEPGGRGPCLPRGGNQVWKRVDTGQHHIWVTTQTETTT